MKALLTFFTAALLSSCAVTGTNSGLFIAYTGSGVEVTGIKGEASGAGYDTKSKTAYVIYADGTVERFKITGAGFGGGKIGLTLEGGGRVVVDTGTGEVTITRSPLSK